MLCEKILGRADQTDLSGYQLDYVNIEWFEAFKKIHKKVTDKGEGDCTREISCIWTRNGLWWCTRPSAW